MTWLGVVAAVCTGYGGIAVIELTSRADEGQDFLSTGLAAVADPVILDVQVGRGAPQLADVRVEFEGAGQGRIQTELLWIDLDTPIPREEEHQSPDSGSRYAAPLRILYFSDDPHTAIAEADAWRLLDNRDKYRRWAAACLAFGLILVGGLVTILVRRPRERVRA
ncbi:hypothetical protein GCM10009804_61130 [Kribbella hippodromi]|uniref:DUF3592 domain-containing protein n=2 Tax=Kribbella hippodromi TaxID=434347 RepID=A0ABP4Q0G9_9ACTN